MAGYYSKRHKAYFTKKLNEARRGSFGWIKRNCKKAFKEYSDFRRTPWGYRAPTKQHVSISVQVPGAIKEITIKGSLS